MKQGVYGIAGMYPDRTKNDGKVDSEQEIIKMLEGFPEGEKLMEVLSRFALKANTPLVITVTNIQTLTGEQLDALRNGDMVIKVTGNQKHTYTVTYKDAVKGELLLSYVDWQNVEGVYYEKVEGVWTYIQTDNTPIHE